jgi:hypothetical protein
MATFLHHEPWTIPRHGCHRTAIDADGTAMVGERTLLGFLTRTQRARACRDGPSGGASIDRAGTVDQTARARLANSW